MERSSHLTRHTSRRDGRRKLLLACLTNYPGPVDRVTRLHELAPVNLQRTLQINISDLDPCQRANGGDPTSSLLASEVLAMSGCSSLQRVEDKKHILLLSS